MTLDDRAADAAEPIDREEEEDRVAAESLAAGDPTGWFEQRNRPRRNNASRGFGSQRRQQRMEHLWSRAVAIGGKSDAFENASNRGKALPWVATSCDRVRMVRRGSTVRVRQRTLQKPCKAAISVQVNLQMLQCAVDREPFMELSGSRSAVDRRKTGSPTSRRFKSCPRYGRFPRPPPEAVGVFLGPKRVPA
jgi:hypothetical protein